MNSRLVLRCILLVLISPAILSLPIGPPAAATLDVTVPAIRSLNGRGSAPAHVQYRVHYLYDDLRAHDVLAGNTQTSMKIRHSLVNRLPTQNLSFTPNTI